MWLGFLSLESVVFSFPGEFPFDCFFWFAFLSVVSGVGLGWVVFVWCGVNK